MFSSVHWAGNRALLKRQNTSPASLRRRCSEMQFFAAPQAVAGSVGGRYGEHRSCRVSGWRSSDESPQPGPVCFPSQCGAATRIHSPSLRKADTLSLRGLTLSLLEKGSVVIQPHAEPVRPEHAAFSSRLGRYARVQELFRRRGIAGKPPFAIAPPLPI